MERNTDDTFANLVALRLQGLTDAEIAQLNLGLNWNDGQSRKHCESRPWFDKIKDFFTEKEGQEVHEQVREAVARVVNMRLK